MNMPFQQSAKPIAPQDAVAKVTSGEAVLVDIREIKELQASGIAANALHIPMMMIQTKADPRHPEFHVELSIDKPIILYCASGARAGMAAQTLLSFGFKEVYNLGGLTHWHQGGGEVVRA